MKKSNKKERIGDYSSRGGPGPGLSPPPHGSASLTEPFSEIKSPELESLDSPSQKTELTANVVNNNIATTNTKSSVLLLMFITPYTIKWTI